MCFVELIIRQLLSNAWNLKKKKKMLLFSKSHSIFTSVSVTKCGSMVINDTFSIKVYTRCRESTEEEVISVRERNAQENGEECYQRFHRGEFSQV